jgi:hypothetical protein
LAASLGLDARQEGKRRGPRIAPRRRLTQRSGAGAMKDPGPRCFACVAARYPRGGRRTLRRSVLPSSFTTSSVVSRVQMCLKRSERPTSTSVLDGVF